MHKRQGSRPGHTCKARSRARLPGRPRPRERGTYWRLLQMTRNVSWDRQLCRVCDFSSRHVGAPSRNCDGVSGPAPFEGRCRAACPWSRLGRHCGRRCVGSFLGRTRCPVCRGDWQRFRGPWPLWRKRKGPPGGREHGWPRSTSMCIRCRSRRRLASCTSCWSIRSHRTADSHRLCRRDRQRWLSWYWYATLFGRRSTQSTAGGQADECARRGPRRAWGRPCAADSTP